MLLVQSQYKLNIDTFTCTYIVVCTSKRFCDFLCHHKNILINLGHETMYCKTDVYAYFIQNILDDMVTVNMALKPSVIN